MALSNIILNETLQALITLKEPLLKERLEGGLSTIRNEDFLTNDFKNEELISPPAGLYKVNKEMEEWVKKNVSAPGMDPDEIKKKVWKKHSDEMSKEISKQLTNWLKDDVMLELSIIINNQIKKAEINIEIPVAAINCAGYTNATEIHFTTETIQVVGIEKPPEIDIS
jgi:hypothetical protein